MNRIFIIIYSFLFLVYFFTNNSEAHSGRTNSEGCHNVKKTGEYHCHNPKYYRDDIPYKNPTKTVPKCTGIQVTWVKNNQEAGKGKMRVDFKSSSATPVIINDLTIWTINNSLIHKYELDYVLKPYDTVTKWFALDNFNQNLIHNATYNCSVK